MASFVAMLLIKDFVDEKIVYYWADESEIQASPNFSNIEGAEEWWIAENFAAHEGVERRKSLHDRRKLHANRTAEARSRHIPSMNPDGRRYTDEPIKLHKDKSRVKILQFYSKNPDLLNGEIEVD